MSESPEFAALRRQRLYYEELAKRNREEMGMSEQPIDCNQPPPGLPPQGLPPEFREFWDSIEHGFWPSIEYGMSNARAALSEIAALNMQVVSNAKASEAERDRLRAVIAAKDAALDAIMNAPLSRTWSEIWEQAREARARS